MIGEESIILPNDLSFVSSKITKVRNFLKMSQAEFGQKINTNQRTVSYLENGDRIITAEIICKLVLDVKVNPYWLLWDELKNTKANLSISKKFVRSLILVTEKDLHISDFDKPDKNGELNIFLAGAGIVMRDKIDNFVYSNEELKQQAVAILNEIEEFKPTLARMYDKIDELKEILSKL
ncbi:MAG: helix-turn-helix transcriptional regulator [Sulfuricurvum sp.]